MIYKWLTTYLKKCSAKIASLDEPEIYEEFVDD